MDVYYNNKELSAQERMDFCAMADDTIYSFSESIDGVHEIAENIALSKSEGFKRIMSELIDVSTFISYSYCDIMVLTKLFLSATNHYERAFLRGKLKVLLNESFKKLYGYTEKSRRNTYFFRLKELSAKFPQFTDRVSVFSTELNELSIRESWWKDERNAEVHFDIKILYRTRHERINESKVVMETTPLIDIFNSLNMLMNDMSKVIAKHIEMQLNERKG